MGKKTKIREEAEKLNPIDDLLFRKMAEEKDFCEEILRVILGDNALTVTEAHPQYAVTNLQGRSVILDAKCITGDGKHINVEVQKSDHDDHQRRVRYHGSVLTANITDTGERFEKVPDVCIVYLSAFDMFGNRKPLYHIDRVVRETGCIVDNGFTEVYVNAVARDGSEISELMRVFVEDDAYSEKFPVTSAMKRRYKQTEEGKRIMGGVIEKFKEEGRLEGRLEGRTEERERINRLNVLLMDSGRLEDMKRAAENAEFQQKLMGELLPEKK